jgi:antitoxin VapB
MIDLSHETEALARQLAAARKLPVDAIIREALEASARRTGVTEELQRRKRMTVEEMLAAGAEIAAMPLLDPRSPQDIIDDINAL